MLGKIGSGVRSIASNASYSIAAKALNIVLRLVYVVLLARMLEPADYGLFVYALSWYVLFMPLTNLGQDLELARAIGGRSSDALQRVSATFTLRLYTTLVTFAAVAILGWLFNPDERGITLLMVVSVAMLPRSFAVWSQTVFIASEKTRYMLQQDVVFRPLELLAALFVLLTGGDALAVAWVHVGAWFVQALAGLYRVWRYLFAFRFLRRVEGWQGMLGFGTQIGVSRLGEGWFQNGPVIMFRQWSNDLEALALLAFCMQVQNLVRVVPKALTSAAMPVIGRTMERGEPGAQRFLLALGGAAALVGATLAAVVVLAGPVLIDATVGASFAAVQAYLPAVCWMAVLPILGNAAQKVIGLQGNAGTAVFSSLAGGLMLAALGAMSVPGTGVVGVLFAAVVGGLVWVLGLTRPLGAAAGRFAALAIGSAVAASLSLVSGYVELPAIAALGVGLLVLSVLVWGGWRLDRRTLPRRHA